MINDLELRPLSLNTVFLALKTPLDDIKRMICKVMLIDKVYLFKKGPVGALVFTFCLLDF